MAACAGWPALFRERFGALRSPLGKQEPSPAIPTNRPAEIWAVLAFDLVANGIMLDPTLDLDLSETLTIAQ